ncbi:transcriptional regulator, GntR family [Lutibaculum baratangense AMV1]|uniref:Transcriptional regulator, GntR family n=2 Tax=Lutibaculum TaxID=1358438 RepID=V4R111_9HYPH|nr:transcriptional regulator, GntR family [Lutibaculum baratangense AMV1]
MTAAARRLADLLFAEIIAGSYVPGTKLPAERALAAEHDVSRATVRQALQLLERHGVIARRAGSGSVVRYKPAPQAVAAAGPELADLPELSQITSPLELAVVRSIVEPEIARLAVLNMTGRDIEAMKAIEARLQTVSVDGEAFSRLDDELYLHLAKGSRNPLLLAFCRLIQHVNRTAEWSIRRRAKLSPGRIRDYQLHARSICQAIENRDVEAAVEHVKLSLGDFHQELVGGF